MSIRTKEVYLTSKDILFLEEKKKLLKEEQRKLLVERNSISKEDIKEENCIMLLKKINYDIPNEISKIDGKLRNFVKVEDEDFYKNHDGLTVIIGTSVVLDFGGTTEKYEIHGMNQRGYNDFALGVEAPIVIKILGKKVGEVIFFNGERVEILEVTRID
ncbi:MAG: hypothetical protein PHR25_02905 [Clostridia bacterium]|nr:hypothetical protein [Clostridia bacterium]MDD4375710.1 hypothetical protein [Clostridia bacterium]